MQFIAHLRGKEEKMKRFWLLLLTLALTGALLLSSCTVDDGSNSDGSGDVGDSGGDNSGDKLPDYNNDDITFDVGEVVSIVISGEHTDAVETLKSELFHALGKTPKVVTPDNSTGKNELFIGRCDSALSNRAYDMMERTERESDYQARVTVYSNGKSVAIAYDILDMATDYSKIALEEAIDFFVNKYVEDGTAINFKSGFSETHTFDVLEKIAAEDSARIESVWAKIEKNAGADTVKELRAMYEMFSPDVLNWLADLYDPETGGFYYSNSARNNEGFLPDIETTAQAIDLLRLAGCFDEYEKDPAKALPDWFKAKLIAFVKGLQDPNGYFYHPQWTHEMVDNRVSRRSRDLTKGLDLLTSLGAKPTYDTPNGIKGDGILADGTPVGFDKPVAHKALTDPIRTVSVAAAVSKLVPTATAVPSNLASKEAFVSYLNGLDLKNNSYTIGNDLASQSAEIKARDEYLASIGADYRLKDILQEWLWENCYESTGHWQPAANYDGLNGLMKISAACSALGIPLKYPEAAARSALDAITTDEYNETVCYAYNAWFTLNNIFNILNKCHSEAEADTLITAVRDELTAKAPELIRATAEKQSIFRRDDGSFSYTEKSTSATSQGMPVAVPGTLEGDVNATIICLSDTCHQMFSALGYQMPSMFGTADLYRFLDKVASLSPVVKVPEEIVISCAEFDDEKLSEQTQSLKISNSSTSTFNVIEDPREGASKNAKVLEFDAKSDGGKRVRLEMDLSANPNSRCWVFEGEFNFASAPNYEFATLMIGPNSYYICFIASDGIVYLQERSSESRSTSISRDLKTGIPVGEWFKIKVEFYYSTIPDDVRIKLYINNQLISVSDSYFDKYGERLEGVKPAPDARFHGLFIQRRKNSYG